MSDLTYKHLQTQVADLEKAILGDGEAIARSAQQIKDEATDTARVADMIGMKRVDTATINETRELSKIMAGLSDAAIAYAAAGDDTAAAARAAGDQARTTHAGIQEAVSRAPVDVRNLDRDWLTHD